MSRPLDIMKKTHSMEAPYPYASVDSYFYPTEQAPAYVDAENLF